MLEKTKKFLIHALLKLKLIEKIEDKNKPVNEKSLTSVQWYIVVLIASVLRVIIGVIWNLDCYNHAFFLWMTLFQIILYTILFISAYYFVYGVKKLIRFRR